MHPMPQGYVMPVCGINKCTVVRLDKDIQLRIVVYYIIYMKLNVKCCQYLLNRCSLNSNLRYLIHNDSSFVFNSIPLMQLGLNILYQCPLGGTWHLQAARSVIHCLGVLYSTVLTQRNKNIDP